MAPEVVVGGLSSLSWSVASSAHFFVPLSLGSNSPQDGISTRREDFCLRGVATPRLRVDLAFLPSGGERKSRGKSAKGVLVSARGPVFTTCQLCGSALRFSSAFPALRFSCRLQPFDHPLFFSILSQASSRHPPSSPPNVPPCLRHYQSAPKDEKDNDDNNEITIQSIANRAPPFTHSFIPHLYYSFTSAKAACDDKAKREREAIDRPPPPHHHPHPLDFLPDLPPPDFLPLPPPGLFLCLCWSCCHRCRRLLPLPYLFSLIFCLRYPRVVFLYASSALLSLK